MMMRKELQAKAKNLILFKTTVHVYVYTNYKYILLFESMKFDIQPSAYPKTLLRSY